MRDIERLLKKKDLPADVRVDNERALKALKFELRNKEIQNKTQKMAKKYHMVRFFERKKAIRKLKKARADLENTQKTDVRKDIKKARKVLKHCEIDLAYTILFPKSEKYVSLYPNSSNEQELEKNEKAKKGLQRTNERKHEIRGKVEQLIDANTLPFSLDDVLQGRKVVLDDHEQMEVLREEIDAPENENEEVDDDFFE